MIDPVALVAFVATVALLVLTPGPDMLFIVAVGARGGARAGLAGAVGVAAGLAVHALATAFGMAAVFQAVPVAYDVVRIMGAAYLLYLGITTLRRKPDPTGPDGADPLPPQPGWSTGKAFSRGLLTNLLNPKVVLFNAAFMPQFVDPSRGSTTTQLLVLGACFVLVDLLIDGPIGLFAGRLGTWLARHHRARRRLDVTTGSIFIGLSARLALERR
ncbi:LysE family translocator [Pseudonocardia lacus]|uniref:LysE family translocator n=1 Tax=Pseudonocardia lacus TaxID=2835865 RepID=UPI0027E238F3|nr:LysE family translocator [Pseudonocardia lacus]